jgi:hypothetical protein
MARHYLIALVLALSMCGDQALADLRGPSDGPPGFTAAEKQIIARNVALSKLVSTDPWAVRKFLDVLAAHNAAADTRNEPVPGKSTGRKPAMPPKSGKGTANPDIDDLERSSPEAVHDLFQRLKQAGSSQPKN